MRPSTHPTTAVVAATGLALTLTGCTDAADEPDETTTATVTETVTPDEESPDPSPEEDGDGPGNDGQGDADAEGPLPDEDPPQDEAPFPANRAPDTGDASGQPRLSPTDVRFGVHEGYDRIVVDLAGSGSPGWRAEYVEEATEQGSGNPVELDGDAVLQIAVNGVMYPTEDGAEPYEGPSTLTPSAAGVVQEVVVGSIFEGYQELYVGLSSDQPFRVFELADPTRVVIDVQHP